MSLKKADHEKMFLRQKKLGDNITNIFQKLATEEIRSVALQSYDTALATNENEFKANHTVLLDAGNLDEEYFKGRYYDKILIVLSEARKLLTEKMDPSTAVNSKESSKSSAAFEEVVFTREQAQKLNNMSTDMQEIKSMLLALQKGNPSQERLANTLDLGDDKDKKDCNSQRMKTSALLIQFRKEIQKLEDSMSDGCNSDNILIMEHQKSSWEKMMLEIKRTHRDLSINFELDEDIDEELEAIEKQCTKSVTDILMKMGALKDDKAVILEKIKIPFFTGNVEDWSTFHDLFKRLIHENEGMSQVEKLLRLKTHLKADALKVIQSLAVNDCNYKAAWELLCSRFGNKRILFTKLVDKILDQPMANSTSATSLKNLLDTTTESIQALKAMGYKFEDADPILARIVIRKLDREGFLLYEQSTRKSKEVQILDDVMQFIDLQCQALDASANKRANSNQQRNFTRTTALYSEAALCYFCNKGGHKSRDCTKFLASTIDERIKWVRRAKVCQICLSHKLDKKCFSKNVCHCGKKHHANLHLSTTSPTVSSMNTNSTSNVFLATAQVRVKSVHGEYVTLRALIDQGSQITTISEEASQILALPKTRCHMEILGLGGAAVGISKSKMMLTIRPRFISEFKIEVNALVLPRLTSSQPDKSFKFDINEWNDVILADPLLNKSDRVDIVIGSDKFREIAVEGISKKGGILAQATSFGWILSGVIKNQPKSTKVLSATTNLERYWELEEVSSNNEECTEDKICLELFNRTTEVDSEGKIVVHLPIREDDELGNSRKQAMARFLALERKFEANQKLKDDYSKFLREYLQLGHMQLVPENNKGRYYLPHQPVIRENSLTTKLRVVFDASAKTTNGKSLNDIMNIGPKLQKDLYDILIKWRLWKYVITADVEKMYRQVKVAEKDQGFQHILWRENREIPIKEYKLTTVTYGTASAPFLAVRSMFFIADNCPSERIRNIIKDDFYMDDLMSGADSVAECKEIQKEVSGQLSNFGFNLRKWLSNHKMITENMESSVENNIIEIEDGDSVKTLGLQWDPVMDQFLFNINFSQGKLTKRHALSEVARIFDPLGWLSPVTIVVKLFIQKLWLLQLKWDEELSDDLKDEWCEFKKYLPQLQQLRIPRWIQTETDKQFEIHGFADASEKAYAAVVFVKINSSVVLLTARTKVNPIKNRKTLPKLELCAAHLLAKLLTRISGTVKRQHAVYAWSDSTITLAWINNRNNKDKFVRNRVTEISTLIPNAIWSHVCSKDNPADVASRGICARKLKKFSLWWNGPGWLAESKERWPKKEDDPEPPRTATSLATCTKAHFVDELTDKYSSFTKLKRVLAYILRFVNVLKTKSEVKSYLSAAELEAAEKVIVIRHQHKEFHQELMDLNRNRAIKTNSKIVSLHPFTDNEGILRVGGRLENSNLPFNKKHPIILQKSHLASVIIQEVHTATLHGGNRLVESTIRYKYWILGLRNAVKKCIRSCPRCIRYRHETAKQIMGALPRARVTESSPFLHTGVDYAGPINMRCSKGRGQKSYKGYIAVFVCMSTKAVHLEAVSDLTSEAFLAALKRFMARRGMCSHIYSDNGTNFVGANKKLDADFKVAVKNNESLMPILASKKIEWHFIPPAAPHFGGIWEAGVKAVKHHLKRVIGDTKLTFEEMSTLLSQIEAVLNSRPIVSINSESLESTDVLTPGHFLIGRPLNDCPEHIDSSHISSLNRWKLIQQLKRNFWNRWKDEYLHTLQQRQKWKHDKENLKEGTVVIVKDADSHPASWPLGVITEVHSGKDGKVRVVTLKLQNNVLKRPVHKICPLDTTDQEEKRELPANNYLTRTHQGCQKQKNSWQWFGLLLLIILMFKHAKSAPLENKLFSVKELSPNTAVYVDKIGQLNMIDSKWNLVVYYDLSMYLDEIQRIKKLLSKISYECPNMGIYKEACEMVSSAMQRRYNILVKNNNLLINKPRAKRAPFEFMGSLYHILFGMMDADDRDQMEENMRNIFENQQNLKQLVKDQTSIVDSTLNLLKKTTDDVNANFNKMYDQLKVFYDEVQSTRNAEKLTILFQIMSSQLNLMIDECSKIQSDIISLLIDTNHGHVNLNLLTPSQLQKELLEIEKHLPNNLIIPGKTTGTELKEVYNDMEAKGIIMDSQLVMSLEIPLLQVHSSDIYHILKLPIKSNNNNTIMPKLGDEYIVYNFASNMYFLMSLSQLNACKKDLQGQFICIGNKPWKSASGRSCEMSALKKISMHADCAFEEVPKGGLWKQLSIENHWIFTVFDNFVITVDCGQGNRNWVTLPTKGILSLSPGCSATYEGISFTASQRFSSTKNISIEASSWGVELGQMEAKLLKPIHVDIISNTNNISHLMTELDRMKKTNVELKTLQFHTVSGHTSLAIVIVCIIVVLCIYIKHKCCNSKKTIVKLDFSTPLPLRARQNVQI